MTTIFTNILFSSKSAVKIRGLFRILTAYLFSNRRIVIPAHYDRISITQSIIINYSFREVNSREKIHMCSFSGCTSVRMCVVRVRRVQVRAQGLYRLPLGCRRRSCLNSSPDGQSPLAHSRPRSRSRQRNRRQRRYCYRVRLQTAR